MKLDRRKESLRVVVRDAVVVLVDEHGTPVWEDADEKRQLHRLFEFRVAREAIVALEETTHRLQLRQGDQPQHRSTEGRMVERNRIIIARSMPSPNEVRALVGRDRQLDLWRRAA